jgi:long-chain acyl-CoA synthetase
MSAERPWLKSYPKGVPAEIDVNEYTSIPAILLSACARFNQRPAFENMGKVLSYAEIDDLSARFAAYLIHDLKLKKGDRVALMLPNVLQYPIAIFGVLRAGLTVVNTNPMYTARELKHQLVDSGASAIVVLDNFAATLAEVLKETSVKQVITTGVGDMLAFPRGALVNFVLKHVKKAIPEYRIEGAIRFKEALTRGTGKALPAIDIQHEDIAFLQYTGGTTGVSKGAMLTHRNLIANMQQASSWLGTGVTYGEEEIITALPLYHIFALTANCLVFMKFGGLNHLITNPRDMPGFVKTLSGIRFTAITGVNTLFNGLLNTPGFDKLDFSRMHLSLGGGMAVQRAVAERWKKVTGVTLVEAYGLTETSPAAMHEPARPARIQRRHRPSDLVHRVLGTGRGRQAPGARRSGRIVRAWPAGDEGLLAAPGRNLEGTDRRWLAAHRRHGEDGFQRLLLHRGPQEGHDPRVGFQRLSERRSKT